MVVDFSPARVRKFPAPVSGNVIHYDSRVRGLGVRITRNNARRWIFNYRIKGVERRMTIGALADWSLKLAREEARGLRRLVDQGRDPMAERHADRAAPTVRDLYKRWQDEKAPAMRPRSRLEQERLFNQWIEPELGSRKVADVTHEDIDRLHRKITHRKSPRRGQRGTPVRANRAISFASRLFNLAVAPWGMRADNPVRGIEKNPEQLRHRYLTQAELTRLDAALAAEPDRQLANIVWLLLLTGARKGEVLTMRWDDLDLGEPAVWTKPASAVKQARLHRVPLNNEARDMLITIKTATAGKVVRLTPSAFVFPARNELGRVRDIKRGWERLCQRAGITDLHIHDLRHSFASILVSAGYNLPMVGALLGHTQAATTQLYAHLIDTAQRAATETLGALVRKNGIGA
jgi:integrase